MATPTTARMADGSLAPGFVRVRGAREQMNLSEWGTMDADAAKDEMKK